MAIWTVWEHDKFEPARRHEKAVFVRDGFSFWAFLFGPLWLLVNRMIVVLIAYIVVMGAANGAAYAMLDEAAAGWISLILSIWFGFEARGLRRWSLARRGWTMAGIVEGKRLRNAERRYFSDALAPQAEPEAPAGIPAPWGARPMPSVLGVFPEGAR